MQEVEMTRGNLLRIWWFLFLRIVILSILTAILFGVAFGFALGIYGGFTGTNIDSLAENGGLFIGLIVSLIWWAIAIKGLFKKKFGHFRLALIKVEDEQNKAEATS